MPDDTLPLAGIKIIEFSHFVMGPVTGVILADLGATVSKVEPIGQSSSLSRQETYRTVFRALP